MRKEEWTVLNLLLEAVGIVAAVLYLGLQVYYGISYGVSLITIAMNAVVLILVYAGLTLLTVYPERVNGLSKETCNGLVRRYTMDMVRLIKLIFVLGLLFASICDVMGHQINSGYSMVVVVLVVGIALHYERKIFRILRKKK